jgi:hypothetical protein
MQKNRHGIYAISVLRLCRDSCVRWKNGLSAADDD